MTTVIISFIREQYLVCDVCGLKSPSFQSNSDLYITIINNALLQELVVQGLEEILEKIMFPM